MTCFQPINDGLNELKSSALLPLVIETGKMLSPHQNTIAAIAVIALSIFSLLTSPMTVTGGVLMGMAVPPLLHFGCTSILTPCELIDAFAKQFTRLESLEAGGVIALGTTSVALIVNPLLVAVTIKFIAGASLGFGIMMDCFKS